MSNLKKILKSTKPMNNNQTQPTNQIKPSRFHLKTWQWVSALVVVAVIAGGILTWYYLKPLEKEGGLLPPPIIIGEEVPQDKYVFIQITEEITPKRPVMVDYPPVYHFDELSGTLETGRSKFEVNDNLVAVAGSRITIMEPGGGGGGGLTPVYEVPFEGGNIKILSLGSAGDIYLVYRNKEIVLVPQKTWKEKFKSVDDLLGGEVQIEATIKNYGLQDKTKIKLYSKLETQLYRLTQAKNPSSFAEEHNIYLADNKARVVIELPDELTRISPEFNLIEEGRAGKLLQALVPISKLCELSEEPSIHFIRKPLSPMPLGAGLNQATITTDKTEYKQGEMVKTAVFNGLDFSVYADSWKGSWNILQYQGNKWNNLCSGRQRTIPTCLCENNPDGNCPHREAPEERFDEIKPSESADWSWDQKILQGTEKGCSNWIDALPGKYRVEFRHFYTLDVNKREWEIIYSNEFSIKENFSQEDNQPCIFKNNSCCKGEVCEMVDLKCGEGTENQILGCDENCRVIYECVPLNENQTSIKTTNITNFTGPAHITHLDIYGDTIVWSDDSQGSYNIYAYNIITETKQAIQPMPVDQVQPAIYEDKIVWVQASSPDNYELYLYNLNTKQKTALKKPKVTSFGPVFPDIYGNTVVWEEQGVETGTINTASQIYGLNLDTQELKKLSSLSASGYERAAMPKIYDNFVVWEDRSADPTNSHINIYDLDRNQGTSITASRDLGQRVLHQYPNIYQKKIVWSQSLRDLFVYDIINETVLPLNHSELQYEAFMNIYQDLVIFKGCKQTITECDVYLLDINSQNITNISQSGKLQLTNVWPPAVYQNKIVWIEENDPLGETIHNLYMAEIGNK
ncbi:MAG: hypothetical protein ABH896_02030 [Candidatus Jacksonbacteria bacterium]